MTTKRDDPTWLRNLSASLEAAQVRGQIAVSVPLADLERALLAVDVATAFEVQRQKKGAQVGED